MCFPYFLTGAFIIHSLKTALHILPESALFQTMRPCGQDADTLPHFPLIGKGGIPVAGAPETPPHLPKWALKAPGADRGTKNLPLTFTPSLPDTSPK
jgi:hypothetical protein